MTPTRSKPGNYGEGSIYYRKSDARWVGTIEAGWTRTGARRRITVTGKTEAEAKRKLRDKRAKMGPARAVRVEDELWHAAQEKARDKGETVSDVIRRALERYVKRP